MDTATDTPALDRRLARTPIAIVGMSGLFPQARNQREFWRNIVAAKDCIEDVPATHWSTDDYYDPDQAVPDKTYCRRGGFLPEVAFSPMEFGLPPNTLEVTDILQLLSLVVARDLLRDAGCDDAGWYDPRRTGVILGVTGCNSLSQPLTSRLQVPVLKEVVRSCGLSERDAEEIAGKFTKAYIPWEENSFPGMLGNLVAGRIANRFDLGGTNCTVDAACASSLAAVRMAVGELVDGRADLMFSGGCDAENTIFMYLCFSKTPAFSKTSVIRPFDADADGTLIGEGIGMLALKRLADAERDQDRIYAVIRGIGTASDGRFKSIYAPREDGQITCLRRAYTDADCSPATVELVEGHGTGTAAGDSTELAALQNVFGGATDDRRFAAIGSVKSQIGHTKGAAGAAGLIKVAFSLYHKVLPPTINVRKPSGTLDDSAFYVNTESRPWIRHPGRPRRGAVSAFGFGGTDFHVVLEEAGATAPVIAVQHPAARAHLWHAADPAALGALLDQGAAALATGPIPDGDARLGFAAGADDFAAMLELARAGLREHGAADTWEHPQGIFYRRRAAAHGKVAALFAGQGGQYVDMGRAAVLNIPPLRAAFDEANALFGDVRPPLAQVVFPIPGPRDLAEETLRRTEYAQPAICALEAGQYGYFSELGFAPDGVLGHSLGELTGLWAAGSITGKELFRLARSRGRAMAPPLSNGADPGGMAAVKATELRVRELMAGLTDVWVCNYNTPDQLVVGGGSPAIGELLARCARENVQAQRLEVSAAFHTRFVEHALDLFRPAVAEVDFRPPERPVYANTQGAGYATDQDENRRTLTEQLINPVQFAPQVQAMYRDGYRVFVEFGPRRALTRLVMAILGNHDDVQLVAVDAGPGRDSDVYLKRAAVQLAVLGLPLTGINRYTADAPVEPAPSKHTIALTGVNYVSDKRRAGYRDALDNGYTVQQPVPAAAPPAPAPPAPAPPAPAPPAPAAAAPVRPVSPAVPAVPQAAIVQPTEIIPPGNAAAPVANGRQSAAQQHLTMHADYLDSQLGTAERLIALAERQDRNGADGEFARALEAVKEHGLVLGRVHTRASEILRDLALREGAPAAGYAVAAPAPAEPAAPPAPPAPAAPPAVVPPTEPESRGVPAPPAAGNGHRKAPEVIEFAAEHHPAASTPAPEAVPETPPAQVAAVEQELLTIIADKTGYPTDMLEPGMHMEADLGIDSIKRVEILGVLRDRYPQAARLGPEQLAELHTIADIVTLIGGTSTAVPAPAPTAPAEDELLTIIADKTGYPTDMLEPGMHMEADLGIDSIKRVEILGVLRDRYPQAARLGPEQLAELHTIADIITLLGGTSAPATAAEPPDAVPPPAPAAATAVIRRHPTLTVLPAVDRRTSVYAPEPVAVLVDDGSALCPPLADALTAAGWEVELVRLPGARRRRYEAYRVWDLTCWDEDELRDTEAALDTEVDLCVYVATESPSGWADGLDRLGHAVMFAKHLQPLLTAAAESARAAFVTVTQVDGAFGMRGASTDPAALLGGLQGLVKTLAIETPQLFCRALDLAPGVDGQTAARLIVDEVHDADTAQLEVAHDGAHRRTISLTEAAPPRSGPMLSELNGDDLLVVTGGARGVTAHCVRELMRHSPCRLVLLGRTVLADEPEWAVLALGEAAIKAAAADHLREGGGKPVPREVDRLARDVIAEREVRATLAELRELGVEVDYLPVDVMDEEATAVALAPFAGRITGVVHGAGVLADRLISDKSPAEVERVLAVKLAGLHNVLSGCEPDRLRHLVLFSSVAGFFGNRGQVDYAMANAALNSLAFAWKNRHPACHVTAVNWGAWAGGMVTPQLQQLFEARGIALIPLDVGVGMFAGQFTRERVNDVVTVIAPATPLSARPEPPEPPARTAPATVQRVITGLEEEPVIRDHSIAGIPVLPATVALGWCVNVLEQLYPGRTVLEAHGLKIYKGIMFDGTSLDAYELVATPRESRVEVVIRGGAGPAGARPHYGGMFQLDREPREAPVVEIGEATFTGDDPSPYEDGTLFHGPALRGIRRTLAQDRGRLVLECRLDDVELADRAYHGHVFDPVLGDLLLQASLVWVSRFKDSASLPTGIEHMELYGRLPVGEPFVGIVDQVVDHGSTITCTVTACSPDGRVHQRYHGVGVALNPDLVFAQ